MKLSAQKLFVLCACAFFANMPLTSTSRADTTTGAAAMQPGTLPDFSVMVKGLSPSVVNVAVDGTAPRVEGDSTEREKEEGEKEKKDAEVPPFKSVGSGFIVDESGLIFTNYHVIGEAKFATVRLLDDKNEYRATIVGKDQKTDLALLKITPKGPLTVAKLGDSDVVEVGQWVLAIGNQFQLGQTVTAGIISAKSRKVPSRGSPYDSFLQTDASINPGSSGGPLFNTRGEVVGINSAIFSPGRSLLGGSGFNIGIGFAIPVNLAKSVLVQLKTNGRVSRGLLGVLLQQVDSAVAEALELPSADGALIADVLPETPAAKAGFKKFDVVTKFGDHAIRDFDDLPVLVAGTPIGSKVEVQLYRSKHPMTLTVQIDELKDAVPARKTDVKYDVWGLEVQSLNPELARSMGIAALHGVLVTAVKEDSPAALAGLVRGDVIEAVTGMDTPDIDALNRILASLPADKPALIAVHRKDGSRVLTIKGAKG